MVKKLLRKIYYYFPPEFRFFFRKIIYKPLEFFTNDQGFPPKSMIYTGAGDFKETGIKWMEFFIKYSSLNKESDFLDIGSGIGRIAIPLSEFLTGKYEGFDAVLLGVNWCKKHITNQHPNFNFTFVDLYNDLYKSNGISAATFIFPYENNSFDLCCSISIFTHMVPDEVYNYIGQAHRILKKGGYFISTFFLLDEESESLMNKKNTFNFNYKYDDYSLMNEKVKSANVAYDKNKLAIQIESRGFEIQYILKGYWCGRNKNKCQDFQDIIVMRKK